LGFPKGPKTKGVALTMTRKILIERKQLRAISTRGHPFYWKLAFTN
jgi:hypothetical protein